MSRPLILLPEAEEEMLDAMHWYEASRHGLGVEFLGVVDHALERIAASPDEYQPWLPDPRYRRAVLARFPYLVVFELRAQAVEIVAIVHAKREPGYWLARRP